MFSVTFWGSHPDEGNDDCWTGEDFEDEHLARIAFQAPTFTSYAPAHTVAYIVLDGDSMDEPEVKTNPAYDAARCERENAADNAAWYGEIAMQAGMAFGCEGYNDAMGY